MSEPEMQLPEQRVSVGHPVDVVSGAVFTAWHDFEFPGFMRLIWRRFYQTSNLAMTPLGRGWVSLFFIIIREKGEGLELIDEVGSPYFFTIPAGSETSINYAAQMELRRIHEGWSIWYWHHKQRFVFQHRASDGTYLLTRIEDSSGNAILLRYDDKRRLQTLEQTSVGRIFTLKYGARDLVREIDIRVAGFNPRVLVTYEHDAHGRLTRAINPAGAPIQYTYDDRHRLIRETNRAGGSFYFEYGADGRCTKSWGDGRYLERTLEYDQVHRCTRVTDSLGATSTYYWRSDGGVGKFVDPLGNATQRNAIGGLRQKINALGGTTLREFDLRGNLLRHVDPMGAEHKYTYNANDCCIRVIDPDDHEFNWEYDDRGRMIAYISPLGERSTFERGPHGEILSQTDGEGRVIRRRFEGALRWQEVADGLGYFRSEYDPWGRPVLISDPEGLRESYETDFEGRITVNRTPDGTQIKYTFNAEGKPVRYQYLNGSVWTFEYDLFGHMTRVTDPDGGTIKLQYDTEGRRISLVNQRNEELQDAFDPNNRLIRRKFFDGRVEEYEYDAAGRLVLLRKADGGVLRRAYDARSNLTEEKTCAGPQSEEILVGSYKYNWGGKLLKTSNSTAAVEFEYNGNRRLVKEVQNGTEICYRYDRGSRLVEREIVKGKVGAVRFEYDRSGLLQSINDKNGAIQSFDYFASGRVSKRIMRGGVEESFRYDDLRRLKNQEVRHSGRRLVARDYEYDTANNLSVKKDSLRGTYRWKFDALLELAEVAQDNKGVETIAHRPGRDIVKLGGKEFSYEAGSRLVQAGDVRFRYDANGNVSERDANGKTTRYTYDIKGWLTQVQLPDGTNIRYGYDPLGRRVAKQAPDKVEKFLWSGDMLAAVTAEGSEPREFLIAKGSWRPSVQWIDDRAEHVICDALGTPQEIIDARGVSVWWARYSAFGQVVEVNGDPNRCRLRLPGQWEDPETQLHYNVHRYYDPSQARYLTPDPIALMGGANLYDYARDPINWIDPMGLTCSNPTLIEKDPQGRWEIYQHDDGSLTIQADCSQAMSNRYPGPNADPFLRATTHTGADNAGNFPEAILGKDNNVIVFEGLHRSAAAARGAQIPRDPDNPHLGGVPNRPGWMEYHYDPNSGDGLANDPDRVGIPCKDLKYPPGYPHQLPP
jgi:RHS repeat-associated protein